MVKNKEIAVVRSEPSELIRLAIDKGADLDKLERLLNIKRAYDADEARKAFTMALSEFKKEVPVLFKDRTNKQYNSTYVSKGNLINTITPVLSKFGFSASFLYENLPENMIEVICRLTHAKGHSEETSFSAPIDVSGAKNPIQQRKSTTTYLEKITFAGILGIESTEEIDDDGNASHTPIKQSEPIKKETEEKMPDPFADMLAKFAQAKKVLGNKEYYTILGREGWEHANLIRKVAEGNKILDLMRARAAEIKGAK